MMNATLEQQKRAQRRAVERCQKDSSLDAGDAYREELRREQAILPSERSEAARLRVEIDEYRTGLAAMEATMKAAKPIPLERQKEAQRRAVERCCKDRTLDPGDVFRQELARV